MSKSASSTSRAKGKIAQGQEAAAPKTKRGAAPKKDPRHSTMLNFYDVRLSESQHDLYRKILENDITVVTGPAGASKTFTACYAALKLLEKGQVDKIYLTKPIQESGEKLGFLPGTVEEKVGPYMESYVTNMDKMADSRDVGGLLQAQVIEFKPLAYMRGSGYDNCIMLLDEAQNSDYRQLMLYVTRMGRNTKIVIMGDVSQHDIDRKKVALPQFANMLKGIPGVAVHEYGRQDIVRNPILIEITDRYEKAKFEGRIPENK